MLNKIFDVGLIKEKIELYRIKENRLVITLKDSSLRNIDIFSPNSRELQLSGLIDLSDFPEIWTEVLLKSLKDKVFNMSEIFIEFLGLVSTLKWTGLLSKKPIFVPNPALNNLRKQFSSLKIKNDLANVLTNDLMLIEKISLVKPESTEIRLMFIPRIVRSEMDLRHSRLEYMRDPNEIIWKINVGFKFTGRLGERFDKHRALNLISVMNLIAEDVLNVSKEQVVKSI